MATFVIGDLHGYYKDYRRLLVASGLCDTHGNWTGGSNHLWLIGDLVDRGEQGIDCIELTMSLQEQARSHGGAVDALLGNHEMMMLCARKFRHTLTSAGMSVVDQWLLWGGNERDLDRLTDRHAEWLADRPAMRLLGDTLLLHADAMFYVEHGRNPEEVNANFRQLLRDENLYRWEHALRCFSEHRAFSSLHVTGQQRAKRLLKYFGAARLVHGHTPIPLANGEPARCVVEAWTYAGGRCTNVDGGIYLGGPGFVYALDS
jgi:hypothetical protein